MEREKGKAGKERVVRREKKGKGEKGDRKLHPNSNFVKVRAYDDKSDRL